MLERLHLLHELARHLLLAAEEHRAGSLLVLHLLEQVSHLVGVSTLRHGEFRVDSSFFTLDIRWHFCLLQSRQIRLNEVAIVAA